MQFRGNAMMWLMQSATVLAKTGFLLSSFDIIHGSALIYRETWWRASKSSGPNVTDVR